MPYIDTYSRFRYVKVTDIIDAIPEISTKGDLEYLVFALMKKFMKSRESRYSTLHDAVYATQHAADEFRRRFLDKREDEALVANGDI